MQLKQYQFFVAIIYTVVLFLDRLDLTIVNVTLPTVAHYFHVPLVTTDWITMAFLLALALSIPVSSWLGERFGLKRIYILAMALFGLGATLCFFAPNLEFLIACRWLQGIGGGLLIPVGLTMLYQIYDKAGYASITSWTFLPALIAPAVAPFLGGLILESLGWQYVFILSGPLALVLAIVAGIGLFKDEKQPFLSPFDWQGYGLCSLFLIILFLLLSELGRFGFTKLSLIELLGLISLFLLLIKSLQHKQNPLINLNYFKNKYFQLANGLQFCFQFCHFGAIFLINLYLQIGLGMSAKMAGFIMGVQAIGAMVISRYVVRLFALYGAKLPLTLGLLGVGISSPCILFIHSSVMLTFGSLLFFIRGIFSGLCGTPIQTLSVEGFKKNEINQINSIFNAGRQIAISLGVAISSILISLGIRLNNAQVSTIHFGQALKVFSLGFLAITLVAMLGVIIAQQIPETKH
ncbi:MAG: hypothetical protein A3E87_07400 [Gammaproteobacteria bacterium RIFCSPHIGHO2_12_FULL_35_23]|nr:MAG: hypothetical protein A3E87_07400 [Gammaproteobacteria bacterium RIFCSPHIGHO2_12_FULL_35_23]